MNTFLVSFLLILIFSALIATISSSRFYQLKSRYTLFLTFQTALWISLLYISFPENYPLTTSLSFFNTLKFSFLLDDLNSRFLISVMIASGFLLLRLTHREREYFVFPLLFTVLTWLSGDLLTLLISSFLYFFSLHFEDKHKNLPLYLSCLPLLLFSVGFVLLGYQGTTNLNTPLNHVLSTGMDLPFYLIISAFLIPVIFTLQDYCRQNSSFRKNDLKLSITLFTFLFILMRLRGFIQYSNHVLAGLFWTGAVIFTGISIVSVVVKGLFKRPLVPFTCLFFLSFTFFVMGLDMSGPDLFLSSSLYFFLNSLPLYILLIILFKDAYPGIHDDHFKSYGLLFLPAIIFINPWFSMGHLFLKTVSILLQLNIILLTVFIIFLFLLFSILFILFVAHSKRKRGEGLTPERWILFSAAVFLLMLLERGFGG